MFKWDKLLSGHRASKGGAASSPSRPEEYRTLFEADYDRVLYSSAFRRLARKTQVHPRVENDHVHNRLTHSLEVASVSRSFARRLGRHLDAIGVDLGNRSQDDLAWICQAACLGHDIGNPPFGHAGEYAIREWFADHESEILRDSISDVSDGVLREWRTFEGNAQSFRICARSDNRNSMGYVRMTFASLGAMAKYPWGSEDKRVANGKYGFFSSEAVLFREVWARLGLEKDGQLFRHPLSYLTEASDDICYRILDVEDAVSMRIIDRKEAKNLFASVSGSASNGLSLEELRGRAIGAQIKQHWGVFESLYGQIMTGDGPKSLSDELPDEAAVPLIEIKSLSGRIFGERSKVATELGAYKSLGKIIKAICHAVLDLASTRSFDEVSFSKQRCIELCWGRGFAEDHAKESKDWWMIQARDYVSGLTDNLATQLASEIEGI